MLRKIMTSSLRLVNGKLILPNGILQEGILTVTDGRITLVEVTNEDGGGTSTSFSSTSLSSSSSSSSSSITTIDIQGNIIAPGFIDLQWNGGYGIDFSDTDLTEDNIIIALKKLLATGVTAVNPTIISSPKSIYERNIPIVSRKNNIYDRIYIKFDEYILLVTVHNYIVLCRPTTTTNSI